MWLAAIMMPCQGGIVNLGAEIGDAADPRRAEQVIRDQGYYRYIPTEARRPGWSGQGLAQASCANFRTRRGA